LLEGCPIVSSRIPDTPLVVSESFGPSLSAARVAAAIARGLREGGMPEADLCPIDAARGDDREGSGETGDAPGVLQLLERLDFDARMRRARAVIIATARLHERTLAGSVTFEIATRARQGGVPAYALTGENALSAFDGRILDLQLVIEARSEKTLRSAARRLASLV
jgi:glycerate kinase